MGKELLLAKSNFRKNKGTSIGLLLLITLAAMLIGVSLLLYFDAYPIASKEADRLESGDGYIWLNEDLTGVDEQSIAEVLQDDVEKYGTVTCLGYNNLTLPFGGGTVAPSVIINDSSAFHKSLDRTEVVYEDESITGSYIYLPYQFNTSGGYETGDDYSFELGGKKQHFIVKGFTNTTYFGCNNTGTYELVLDDASFEEVKSTQWESNKAYIVSFFLKEGVKDSKFKIETQNKFLTMNPNTVVWIAQKPSVILGKSFMALILTVSFLTVTLILILVIAMMLSNCISNYVRENMKSIGALKATGYTSRNIKNSLFILFIIISLLGGIAGAALSYLIMPIMSKVVIGQMGVPYEASFCLGLSVLPVLIVVICSIIFTAFSTRKIKRINPIVALRDGVEAHNFKKNRVRLDKSKLGINISLALKTMLTNKKQNIITFIVVGILVFVCTLGLLMYENFNRNPKLSILTFETCGGVVGTTTENFDELRAYIESRSDAENIREMIAIPFTYNNEDALNTNIIDDIDRLNNKDICYKGRFPRYENEIAVSGKFAENYGFKIGDELPLEYGPKSYTYLITGLIQTCNNYGREAILTNEGGSHLYDLEHSPKSIWFDCADKETSEKILDEAIAKFGDKITLILNFYETIEGSMTTFKSISAIMLILVCSIAGAVILVILYLLMKALIHNKRKDYGILKSLGYSSSNLILQTSISFMPSIIASVIIFSVISHFFANPYMNLILRTFGLMKCTFTVPVVGEIIIGVGMIALSFVFSLLQARKIRDIEAYSLLVE